jgi:hypothetical protein
VAEMPFQPSCFFFNLSDFHICIFYPGGKLKVTVNSATRRHQIQFTSCDVFFHLVARNRVPLSVFINVHGFRFVVFDPGGDERQFRSPVTVSFPTRGAVCDIASGQPWVLWSSKTQMFASIEVLLQIHLFLTTWSPSLLPMPWDRGKKSCNYMNIFLPSRRRCPSFHGL